MGFTALKSFTTEVLTSSDVNTYFGDNITHLKNTRSYGAYQFTGNYTTTSTSFTNVDGTNLSYSITTDLDNTRILICLCASLAANVADTIYLTVTVGGTNIGNATSGIAQAYESASAQPHICGLALLYNVATAGTYAVNLQWRTASGNTATMYGAGSRFSVAEIG